jgi:hypothetical protein
MNAEHSRQRAIEAAREADRAVLANGRLRRTGATIADDQAISQSWLRLA